MSADVHIFCAFIFGHAESTREQSAGNASGLMSRFWDEMDIGARTYMYTQVHVSQHSSASVCANDEERSSGYIGRGRHTWRENRRRFPIAIEREIFGNEFVDHEIRVIMFVSSTAT